MHLHGLGADTLVLPFADLAPCRGRVSPQAVPDVIDMEYAAEVPMTAFQVGLATVTVVLMGQRGLVWFYLVPFVASRDFTFQVLRCGRPRSTEEDPNIPLDGIDLEQVPGSVGTIPELASALENCRSRVTAPSEHMSPAPCCYCSLWALGQSDFRLASQVLAV